MAATACWVRLDHARVPALAARRNYDEAPTHAYTGGGGLRADAAARASPYISDGCVRVGGFHPGHDAYCQGRYLADNIASWALAGLLVQTHGRQRPDVAVACADACRRAIWTTKYHRCAHLTARHIKCFRSGINDLIHRLHCKIKSHKLYNRAQTTKGCPDCNSRKSMFGDWRVNDPFTAELI